MERSKWKPRTNENQEAVRSGRNPAALKNWLLERSTFNIGRPDFFVQAVALGSRTDSITGYYNHLSVKLKRYVSQIGTSLAVSEDDRLLLLQESSTSFVNHLIGETYFMAIHGTVRDLNTTTSSYLSPPTSPQPPPLPPTLNMG